MRSELGRVAVLVLVVALVGSVAYEQVMGLQRGVVVVRAERVVEGVLIGVVVSLVWLVARRRPAALVGLAVTTLVGLAGVVTPLSLPGVFVESPMSWAIAVAFLVRALAPEDGALARPTRRGAPEPGG